MRRVGGSRRGLDMWLMQRASSIYMALFMPLFAIYVLAAPSLDYAGWRALFMPLGMKVAVLLCVLAVLLHAWIGLREIFIDYLHCARCLALRLFSYFAFATLYLACLVWTVDILWSVK
ncbi:MAG: succinate dehydrogenase, hydrophobic membrane anchor protein [Hydrogenophilales bacterium 28-61-23]|nr:MAG: succinate dehydrogenase, hydrophobic membrane anchor protein [Hydrogenophilales bacterium 28-61-23]